MKPPFQTPELGAPLNYGTPQSRHRARSHLRFFAFLALLILSAPLIHEKTLSGADGSSSASTTADAEHSAGDSWRKLFDGSTLKGWKVIGYAGAGDVEVEDGTVYLGMGAMLTGIVYTNPVPEIDYEVTLKAMKISGSDFFCGLTFPVRDTFCTLIAGGWGGGLVGLSSLDNYDASENETSTFRTFEKNRWYSIRLRVTQSKIEAWLDGDPLIDVSIVNRKISLRPGDIEMSVPLGISAWQTRAALRDIRLRFLDHGESSPASVSKP